MKIIILLVGSLLSGFCYRAGGKGKPFNTKWRDLGVPLVTILTCLLLGLYGNWNFLFSYFLIFGLMFAALSTYRYFLPKPKDYKWYHYALHGLFIGLALMPLMWCGVVWYLILFRAVLIAFLISVLSQFISWDIAEEFLRGFFIVGTLIIL